MDFAIDGKAWKERIGFCDRSVEAFEFCDKMSKHRKLAKKSSKRSEFHRAYRKGRNERIGFCDRNDKTHWIS